MIQRVKLFRFLSNRSRWLKGEISYLSTRVFDAFLWRRAQHTPYPKRILFVAMNGLGLKFLDDVQGVFESDERIDFTVTHSPGGIQSRDAIEEKCHAAGIPYLPFIRVRWQTWDLMVFADHDAMDRFPDCVPKVRLGHGICGSKLVNGVPYRHAPQWIEYRGKVFYSRMFEASDYAVQLAVRHNPKLKGIAVACGDLAADRMLALRVEREVIRTSMGYSENDFVILVQSTYGETSLMESVGRELISHCVVLAHSKDWRFILQTHPHHWTGPRATSHPFGQFLSAQEDKPGITVIRNGEGWAPAMVASDMVITDHTSLSMTYALLGKPMLFVDVPGTTLIEGNPGQRLAKVLPKLSTPGCLAEDIARARSAFPREQVAEIAKDILSYPGEAAERIRNEVCSLLALDD